MHNAVNPLVILRHDLIFIAEKVAILVKRLGWNTLARPSRLNLRWVLMLLERLHCWQERALRGCVLRELM